MSSEGRTQELASLYLDGLISDEEARELVALIQASDTARQCYLEQMRLHGALQAENDSVLSTYQQDERSAARPHGPTSRVHRPSRSRRGQRTSSRPFSSRIALSIGVVLTLCVALVLLRPTHAPYTLSLTHGTAFLNGDTLQRSGQYPVSAGDQVELATQSQAVLTFADNSRVLLFAHTQVALDLAEGLHGIRLLRGKVHSQIAPQAPDHQFRVHTQTAQCVVIGTEFSVSYEAANGLTHLHVEEGTVDFVRVSDRARTRVNAGMAIDNQAMILSKLGSQRPPMKNTIRLVDDFEGVLQWYQGATVASKRMHIQQSPDAWAGKQSLSLRHDTSIDIGEAEPWAHIARDLTLRANENTIRFRLKLRSAHKASRFEVALVEEDQDAWRIGSFAMSQFDASWKEVTVPIPASGTTPNSRTWELGDGKFDRSKVVKLVLSTFTHDSAVLIDQVEVLVGEAQ